MLEIAIAFVVEIMVENRHTLFPLCLGFADFFSILSHCLRNRTFSRFSRTPTCVRRTDGQTDRHTTAANIRAS